jgi:hypothetical protein
MSIVAAPPLRDIRYSAALLVLFGVAAASLVLMLFFAAVDGTGSLADPPERYEGAGADQARRDDLAWVALTLEDYFDAHAAYPSTDGEITTLCAQPGDSGCLLWALSPEMFASDGETPYYYASDGEEYTLFARIDRPPAQDACPAEVPPAFVDAHVHCVVGPPEDAR